MSALLDHLMIAPIVLPLAVGALLLFIDDQRHGLKGAISVVAALVLLAAALFLLIRAEAPVTRVYPVGDWPAPFGIVLVADRLAALMIALAAALGLAALVFSLARWHRAGAHFHTLVQLLLAGLNGSFLTGDVFNLFVFFELMLAASYGLALYGSGAPRVRASLHYIVINLGASLLFLVGVSLMYGVAGTLNMADLAMRVPLVEAEDRALFEIGAAILAVAFFIKAAMWPLGFWLLPAYTAASAPAVALFCILSKVGIYAVLRLWLLVFGGSAGAEWLVYGGMATLAFGLAGMLAAQDLARLGGFSLLVSSGTLLAAIGLGGAATTASALYYLVVSTLGSGAFFLLVELVQRARPPGADILAVTAEAFGLAGEEPEEEVGVIIPAARALLGLAFMGCALIVAGLPPLPGFIAKLSMLSTLLDVETVSGPVWAMLVLLMLSGLAATIALSRIGVRIFWAAQNLSVPRVRVIEIAPIAMLLALCIGLAIWAGPVMGYMKKTADALHSPRPYIEEVLIKR
ncbi:MAG: monovalent cation/H+ antiporter subunit D [Betaproteobacteria bacterium]